MSETIKQQKVLMMCGSSQTVINFRMGLIRAFQAKDINVSVVALDDDYKDDIIAKGIEFFCVNTQNRSLNPFGMKKLQKQYFSIIQTVHPDIVFTFMLKPNIFGTRAAKQVGVEKIFSMVEGAGDVFINNGLKWKLIRAVVCKMYRKSFKYANKVFFLNNDDKAEFIARKIVKEEQCEVIPGIGVDLEHFAYKPLKNHNTFLMIARMLKTKGVTEYCQAARLVKQKYPDAVFNYLGAEGTLKVSDIQEYIDDGSIIYLGTTKDVRPYLENCAVYVLPSYREGMPMSIMEAEAIGRAVITTDVQGCKHTVVDGVNGFLVEKCNEKSIADAMINFLYKPQQIDEMSRASRNLVEEKFDRDEINTRILGAMDL
ncbi:MAG: glycosyltransferase family 4 protein [Clostridia bacterium]|nr:glycosyltransferase family 4 protein [Clostridia bacterium]